MAADQFCLRWNNFQLNIASALDSLKTEQDLVDVTLSCEGQNVKAHKVVLSACSPYFRGVFKENPCQHPIVILKDVSYDDVSALLSFMYQGEVYITQDRLASFLHTAELLQVRGLTGATSPFKDTTKVPTTNSSAVQQQPSTVTRVPVYSSTSYRPPAPVEQSSSFQQSPQPPVFPAVSEPALQFQRSAETDTSNQQPSSPQPPTAKRRKAFPRRVSVGGYLSAEETTESQDSDKGKSRSGEEPLGCEVVSVGVAPVKQEPEDESIFEVDATMEEESNPISFSNAEDDVVQMESPGSENTRRMEFYSNIDADDPQHSTKEESLGDGIPILGQHSMLLRSLSGTKQPMIVGDMSPSRLSDGTIPVTRPMEEGDGANYKTPGNIQAVYTSTAWSVNMANRRLSSGKHRLNALNERPAYGGISQPTYNRSTGTTSNSKNSLYQQRKHSWRSRRPVQCPNCQKVITMAYNLKSHLSTCLKRNGVRNKVQIKCEGNSTNF